MSGQLQGSYGIESFFGQRFDRTTFEKLVCWDLFMQARKQSLKEALLNLAELGKHFGSLGKQSLYSQEFSDA